MLYIRQGQDGLATGLSPPHSVPVLFIRQGQDGLATGLSSHHSVPVLYTRQRQHGVATVFRTCGPSFYMRGSKLEVQHATFYKKKCKTRKMNQGPHFSTL